MAAVDGQIKITGLKELQRALKDADASLPRQLRVALNAGAELVIKYARPRIPERSGRGRASLKMRSTQRLAQVAIGGKRAPYMGWLDFGGEGRRRGRPGKPPFIK